MHLIGSNISNRKLAKYWQKIESGSYISCENDAIVRNTNAMNESEKKHMASLQSEDRLVLDQGHKKSKNRPTNTVRLHLAKVFVLSLIQKTSSLTLTYFRPVIEPIANIAPHPILI
jgi:hypothetical protein